jgi:hypothetical protein
MRLSRTQFHGRRGWVLLGNDAEPDRISGPCWLGSGGARDVEAAASKVRETH